MTGQFKDFAEAIAFVNRVAEAAEEANHHPDILVHGWNKVRLSLTNHSAGGLTEVDFEMAGRFDGLAEPRYCSRCASISGCGPRACTRRAVWRPPPSRAGASISTGVAVKPSREVGPGDELELTLGPVRRTLIVRGRRSVACRRPTRRRSTTRPRQASLSVGARRSCGGSARRSTSAGVPTKRDRRRFDTGRR